MSFIRRFFSVLILVVIFTGISCFHSENVNSHFVSTYLSGTGWEDGDCIAIDKDGYIYVAGSTNSPDFPATAEAYCRDKKQKSDVFIAKFNHDLKTLQAATLIGGSGMEGASSIKVDNNGHVFIAGYTESSDFPTTESAFDTSYNGGKRDAFLLKLDGQLKTLLASTFFGGIENEARASGPEIEIDKDGNIFIAGETGSQDLPITADVYDETYNDSRDIYIAKFNNELTTLLASTYLGGKDNDYTQVSIALSHDEEHLYIAGSTVSQDFPTTQDAFQRQIYQDRSGKIFISKLDVSLRNLSASTFLAGSFSMAYSLALDKEGNVFVGGHAFSDFPITSGAFNETCEGHPDGAFLSKLDGNLTTLLASTFLGGSVDGGGRRVCLSLAIDEKGAVYTSGWTGAQNFPTSPGVYDETHNGAMDVFVVKFSNDLKKMYASTVVGGSGRDRWNQLILHKNGNVYVTGCTYSSDFPATPEAFQERPKNTECSAFLFKINNDLSADKNEEIHIAAKKGELKQVMKLLEKNPNLIEKKDKYSRTPLHGAGRYGCEEVAGYLLEENAQIGAKDESGNTPLHLAAMYNHKDVLKRLLSEEANPNEVNNEGNTALHLASQCGSLDAVGLLLAKGAWINHENKAGDTPLHLGIYYYHSKVVELLSKQGADLNIKNNAGNTPLHIAKNIEITEFLIKNGAQLNSSNNENKTPLHIAFAGWNIDLARLCILDAANYNMQDKDGKTPLHYAAMKGSHYLELIKEMIKKGADITMKDKDGKTPLDLAIGGGNKELIELLKGMKN